MNNEEKKQLEQMIESIRYIFICDYYYEDINDYIKIEKGTIINLINVSRNRYSKDTRVIFILGTKTIHIPINDFQFCTKPFDIREIQVEKKKENIGGKR